MNKKQKSSIILASLASIAVAGSLLAGSTYALFTSESKTNIAVTSGTVDVEATISELKTYSDEANCLTGDPTADTDHIKTYEDIGIDNGTFLNAGTATYTDGTLTLDKMTPGDKVTFNINITNNSKVAIKYCVKITSSNDTGLFNGLNVNIPDHSVNGDIVWTYLAYDESNTSIANIQDCSITLPTSADNDYQDKKCDITISVEAIQGNAETEDIYYISNQAQLVDATNKAGKNRFILSDDITLTRTITFYKDGNNVLDLNTHTIERPNFNGAITSYGKSVLTVKNGTVNGVANVLDSENGGNLIIENVTATTVEACIFAATNATLTVNSGTFNTNITSSGYFAVGVCFTNTGTGITSGKVGDSDVQVPTRNKVVQDFHAGFGNPEVINYDANVAVQVLEKN